VIERDPTSGTQLAGAASALVEMACVLSNDKGTWTVTTPGKVRVMRSSQPLHVGGGVPGQPSAALSCGKRITSRIDGLSVKSITRRSMPMPSPAVGGSPYSSARM